MSDLNRQDKLQDLLIEGHSGPLICPACGGNLLRGGEFAECDSCHRFFGSSSGLPLLFWPNNWDGKSDATEAVTEFYEANPFPNYEDVDSASRLREMASRSVFAKLLDHQIPYGANVLEVGCGTGQLSNFLGMRHGRSVVGTDICLNSLTLAENFRQLNDITNTRFLQMNLFRPVFPPVSFDLVLCNGVLHHTSDPLLGFETISRLVKPGGFVIVGLYNRFGRIPSNFRKAIFAATGSRFKFLDSRLRDPKVSQTRKEAWFVDQYKHPQESKHTIGEVLNWFDASGITFVNSLPKSTAGNRFTNDEKLFEINAKGTWLNHFLIQAGILLSGGKEGGFFLMIGQKQA